jgi:diacylglycerol kinase (ATP)
VGNVIRRLLRATVDSWRGLLAAVRAEQSFQQELVVLAVLTPVALWLERGGVERALLLGSLLLILIVELLNSGLEAVVDRIGRERHPLAGRAKDLGSAAVFLSLVNAGLIWLLVLVF